MKIHIYLSLIFFIFFCQLLKLNAQEIEIEKRKALLVGYWNIEDKGTLIITQDGSVRIDVNGEVLNTGNWKLNDQGTVFYILEDERIVETMNIVEVSDTQFIFKPENSKEVTLNRTSAEAIKMPDELTDAVESKATLSSEEVAQRRALLVGSWIVGDDNTLEIQANSTIQEKKKGKIGKTGTWQLSEDGNTFSVFEEGELKEGLTLFEVTEEKIIGKVPNGMDIIIVREKPLTKIDVAERKKLLIGTWEVNQIDVRAIENPDTNLQLIIKKDGIIISKKEKKFERKERWELSPQGDYLQIISKDEPEQKMRILQLDKEKMQLMSGSQSVDFIRIK